MTLTGITSAEIAAKIDHTLLKPTCTRTEIEALCQEAAASHFKTVCVPPCWVRDCVTWLKGTGVGTITVVGFPFGYQTTQMKREEAKAAILAGAVEIDVVINLSWVKSGMLEEAENEIHSIVQACGRTTVKVILETAYLTDAEKVSMAQAAERAGAKFVKTSTGFATGMAMSGATIADVQLLRKNLKPNTLIKASGGIRDHAMARQLIEAGADRLGTSSGVAILKGLSGDTNY